MRKSIKKIEDHFEFSKYGTNWRTEISAGLGTYLSLAYIFIVNPAILSHANMSVSAVLFATVIVSAGATLCMGLIARLPFAVAPGLELDSFFAFVVCGPIIGFTWQQGLGAVFISGLLCTFFTLRFIRQKIVNSIPFGLRKCMGVAVGIFVLTIGLFLAGIVSFEKGTIHHVNLSMTPKVIALIIGLIVSAVLSIKKLKFPAGMLIAIIIAAIFCRTQNIVVKAPAKISSEMFSAIGKLDIMPHSWKFLPVVLVFFLIDFFGGIGKFLGLTAATNLIDKDGQLPRVNKAMYVDAFGTVASGVVGTSSVITYVESLVGIKMGGRTGIVAIVCGLLMLCSLFFTPLVGLVPVEATAGILCWVGFLLMRDTWGEKLFTKRDWVVAILMIAIIFGTFNLGYAMAFGFTAYTLIHIFDFKNREKLNWYLICSTIAILFSVALQFILT